MQLTFTKVLAVIFIVSVAGYVIWQSEIFSKDENNTAQMQNTNIAQNFGSNTADTSSDSNSFIENLRTREFTAGEIKVEQTLANNGSYTSYLISYPSDNLKIYGVMKVPAGNGPFPVIILNHGYYNPSSFQSGNGTDNMANILAANGYLTLASDYRGHGQSENDQGIRRGGHRPEYAIDVLNLMASVKNLPKADSNRIGMWGHSMGGEVALRVVEATDQIKALVLWAPTATRASDNRGFAAGRHMQGTNPSPDSNQDGAAPMNYLKYIQIPISLHQGLADTEVDPEGSKQLNEALKKETKQIEYFEYEGQDHNFSLGWDLISKRNLEFFDKYLKK